MKLEDIEKLIAGASPWPWPAEFGRSDFPDEGAMACGPIIAYDRDAEEDADEKQAQADQDFICMARELMPKMLMVLRTAKLAFDYEDYRQWMKYGCLGTEPSVDHGTVFELLEALAELEQP